MNLMQVIDEGKARIRTDVKNIPTKDMGVFYNPVMKFNRDFTIALLGSVKDRRISAADPMAATGIRAIRMEKELKNVSTIDANDISTEAVKLIRKNIKANRCKKIQVMNMDANKMLEKSYDYIDIDPFGYPGPFIKSAMTSVKIGGILAVTATDTAALTGSAPGACLRKYGAKNSRNWMMHEIGLRIMIGWIARKASEGGKSIEVLASYSKDHYMRVFSRIKKHKKIDLGYVWRCDNCLEFGVGDRRRCTCKNETRISGPLWLGKIGDARLLKRMRKRLAKDKFISYLQDDYASSAIGFHDVHELCSNHKTKAVPAFERIMKTSGAKRTHYSRTGLRSDKSAKEISKVIRKSS